MTTIITTTGISLYINTGRDTRPDEPTDDQMRQYLRMNPERASAEANSLLQIAQHGDHIVLLHTETQIAQRCAILLQDFFINEQGFQPYQIKVKQLDFQDNEQYMETQGLRNLVNTLMDEIHIAQKKDQKVVINATAGFKSQIVYSTMIGMLYQIPVKYIHEKFNRIITINPIAIDWNTSIILTYDKFFTWLRSKDRTAKEVEDYLLGLPEIDRERVRPLLTSLKIDGEEYIFLSTMGNVLQKKFILETEEAEEADWPPVVDTKDVRGKIAHSIAKHGHDYPKGLEAICEKIALIPYVTNIVPEHFENSSHSRLKHVYDNGSIVIQWTDDGKAARLKIQTTAFGKAQTRKVADLIISVLNLE